MKASAKVPVLAKRKPGPKKQKPIARKADLVKRGEEAFLFATRQQEKIEEMERVIAKFDVRFVQWSTSRLGAPPSTIRFGRGEIYWELSIISLLLEVDRPVPQNFKPIRADTCFRFNIGTETQE